VSRVVVLTTGGTIASWPGADGSLVAAEDGAALVERVLDATPGPRPKLEVREVMRRGSYALDHADLRRIALATHHALSDDTVAGVVVTHGTDTLEETAALLAVVHDDPRPVVLTGAQVSADQAQSDGPSNLVDAVRTASDPNRRGQGVLVAFGGQVLPAWGLSKSHTTALAAFVSATPAPRRPTRLELPGPSFDDVLVPLVSSHVGADGSIMERVVAEGADGVVLVGTGLGNATPLLTAAVARSVAAGTAVGVSTRVWQGPLQPVYGGGGGADLVAAGAVLLSGVPASQARIVTALVVAGCPAKERITRLRDHARTWVGDD